MTEATKIDLDDDGVYFKQMTVEEARTAESDEVQEKLINWLDEAQANAFSGELPKTYLVIEITK
jgi:hypothetical protein